MFKKIWKLWLHDFISWMFVGMLAWYSAPVLLAVLQYIYMIFH